MLALSASEFKARCLAILDEVARTGQSVTVLRRGRPIAEIVPPVRADDRPPQRGLVGTVEILGDVVGPVLPPEAWEAQQERR